MDVFLKDILIASIFFIFVAIYISLRYGRGKFNTKVFIASWIFMEIFFIGIYQLL